MSDFYKATAAYWDYAHAITDLNKVGGTPLAIHLAKLCVSIGPADCILCIGIGTGGWVRDAAAIVHETWAYDVSWIAMDKVADIVKCPNNLAVLPRDHFDFVMSYWVSPHMADSDLEQQLKDVIAALKPDGVFAIHYNEPSPNRTKAIGGAEHAAIEWAAAGCMVWQRKDFDALVTRCGGVSTLVRIEPYPEYQHIAVVAHVRKEKISQCPVQS